MSQNAFDARGQGSSSLNRKADPKDALSIKPVPRRRGRNLVLDLPIAWRLTLGFVIAALVAALAAGVVGIQRSQSLSRQTDFYHNLLQLNTSLTNGRSFLDLMNLKLQQTFADATTANASQETVANDTGAIANLVNLYNQTLNTYTQTGLVEQHPDQLALLQEANASNLATQQRNLTDSAQRTWRVYQTAQQQILNYISNKDTTDAQTVWQQQGQFTSGDALSALQSLLKLNDRLASMVDSVTNVEANNELLTTLIATLCAFLAVVLVGWFISGTLVRRLRDLHRVTRAVEEGRISERVLVTGRDEIAGVSSAVNAMLDTIFGLLEETRQQRDALAGAAEHLFTDMRIVNAGDLRVNATVSNDPIGMLANAFNFTVGRFRRFILRTQTTVEQLDVVSRQGLERSSTFISLVRTQMQETSTPKPPSSTLSPSASALGKSPSLAAFESGGSVRSGALRKPPSLSGMGTGSGSPMEEPPSLTRQVQQTQEGLFYTTRDDLNKRLNTLRETVERASTSIKRLSELISTRSSTYTGGVTERMTQAQLQELLSLESVLGALAWELQQTQFTSTTSFTKLDAALTRLARQAAEQPTHPSAEAAESMAAQNEQFQEFVRQAGSFGVEINTLSKRLAAIIQEMRTGITPFRLDSAAANMNDLTKSINAQEQPIQKVNSGNLASTW